jgi:hypothetical protein
VSIYINYTQFTPFILTLYNRSIYLFTATKLAKYIQWTVYFAYLLIAHLYMDILKVKTYHVLFIIIFCELYMK